MALIINQLQIIDTDCLMAASIHHSAARMVLELFCGSKKVSTDLALKPGRTYCNFRMLTEHMTFITDLSILACGRFGYCSVFRICKLTYAPAN
jgi:hypothetical protein